MRRFMLVAGVAPMVGILALASVAYSHALTVASMYDASMHRDIQASIQALSGAGLPPAQLSALRSVLNDINHDTLGYVSSATDTIIGIATGMALIVASTVLALVGRITSKA